MPSPEQREERRQESDRAGRSREPYDPSPLPPELAEFLRDREFACLTHPTDQGTVLLIKAPRREIRSVEGTVPISFHHQLYECPTAPVIRMLTMIYDQPARPLALETFLNVQDPEQRFDYEALTLQDSVYLLFYDERLEHRLTKMVGGLDRERIGEVLRRAVELYEAIPEDQFSFEIAKARVMATTTL